MKFASDVFEYLQKSFLKMHLWISFNPNQLQQSLTSTDNQRTVPDKNQSNTFKQRRNLKCTG